MTSQWISKEEAGSRLGVGARRILELAKEQGRLQWDESLNPKTGKMVIRIQAGSVERYLAERGTIPDPEPRPRADNGAMTEQTNGHATAQEQPPQIMPIPATLARRLLKALTGASEAPAESAASPARLWLTVKEAVDYSGLPMDVIKGLIGKGELKAMFIGEGRRGGAWRIRKVDLEAFAG